MVFTGDTLFVGSVGQRASIAARVLKKDGFKEVYNVMGGITAWTNLGYPTVK